MGKNKIDPLKQIEDKSLANIAFCKRKRGFLKKAIEMSSMCNQKILIVIYEEDKKRMIQFSSHECFDIEDAERAYKTATRPEHIHKYERYSNKDYFLLEKLDFRSMRYKRKEACENLEAAENPASGEQKEEAHESTQSEIGSDPLANSSLMQKQINELTEENKKLKIELGRKSTFHQHFLSAESKSAGSGLHINSKRHSSLVKKVNLSSP